jgi:hypothetical protein
MHMGSERVHIVMAAEERAAFRAAAERAGVSLSEWLRGAARDRLEDDESLQLQTVEDLDRFFAASDAAAGDDPEPDWAEHLAVMADSRRRGLPS